MTLPTLRDIELKDCNQLKECTKENIENTDLHCSSCNYYEGEE